MCCIRMLTNWTGQVLEFQRIYIVRVLFSFSELIACSKLSGKLANCKTLQMKKENMIGNTNVVCTSFSAFRDVSSLAGSPLVSYASLHSSSPIFLVRCTTRRAKQCEHPAGLYSRFELLGREEKGYTLDACGSATPDTSRQGSGKSERSIPIIKYLPVEE